MPTLEVTQEEHDVLINLGHSEAVKKEQGILHQWFGGKDDEPTKAGLMKYAERYFRTFQCGLNSGSVKEKVGILTITISFVVEEDKR